MLTAEKVESVLKDCLFLEGEDKSNAVKAEGITTNYGFHPTRLNNHALEIAEMLDELPDTYKANGGGGMSFTQACFDKHGNQWTSFHRTMEGLFCLGMAIGKVECLMPRKMWTILPGGMPYYLVKD